MHSNCALVAFRTFRARGQRSAACLDAHKAGTASRRASLTCAYKPSSRQTCSPLNGICIDAWQPGPGLIRAAQRPSPYQRGCYRIDTCSCPRADPLTLHLAREKQSPLFQGHTSMRQWQPYVHNHANPHRLCSTRHVLLPRNQRPAIHPTSQASSNPLACHLPTPPAQAAAEAPSSAALVTPPLLHRPPACWRRVALPPPAPRP